MDPSTQETRSPINIRPAQPADASAITILLNKIIAQGGTTAYEEPFDEAKTLSIIQSPSLICSFVATVSTEEKELVGFQFLEWSDPNWPGEDRFPADWGIIATFVDVGQQGKGIGRGLFDTTAAMARSCHGCNVIDATIRNYNTGGQAFYSKMGFVDYKSNKVSVSKRYDLR